MSTSQTLPTAAPRTRRTVLPIAALLALVVAAAAVVIAAGEGSDPARTEFRLPSHVSTHGGAPVPDVSSAVREREVRYELLPLGPVPIENSRSLD